jgi:hypothetical protein
MKSRWNIKRNKEREEEVTRERKGQREEKVQIKEGRNAEIKLRWLERERLRCQKK